MRVLFLHPNFPAQFRHVAGALGRDPGNRVVFATKNERPEWNLPGVKKALYAVEGKTSGEVQRLAAPFDEAAREGEAVWTLCRKLRRDGFVPELIYAHSGWGTSLFVRDAFPEARLMCYFEWFYDPFGRDANFDATRPGAERPEPWQKPPTLMRTRNIPILGDLWTCVQGLSPTLWQRSQFPRELQPKIAVLHDGVDTSYFKPDPEARLVLKDLDLSGEREIVTFAGRGMEPYRGFPQFMEAAAMLLRARPGTHVVVAGSERVCYGSPRADGRSWKEVMLDQLDFPRDRLHFVGSLPYGQYLKVLQASAAHVYLTRPFVLSWSAVEALSTGCMIVASDTPPVREAMKHEVNALLADFWSPESIAAQVARALDDRDLAGRCRANARRTALARFDLARLLPLHLQIMAAAAAGKGPVQVAARKPNSK